MTGWFWGTVGSGLTKEAVAPAANAGLMGAMTLGATSGSAGNLAIAATTVTFDWIVQESFKTLGK